MSLSAGLLLALVPAASLVAADRVELSGRSVLLSDVAAVRRDDARGSLIVARIPEGTTSVRLSRSELAGLIRRAVPGIELNSSVPGSILLVAPAAAEAPARCLELVTAKAAGDELLADDVMPVSCPGHIAHQALRYDRASGANVALHDLEAGAIIAGAKLAEAPALRRGDRLSLSSSVGPVTIQRPVILVQDARPGDRQIFVKTNDGEILAAQIQAEGAKSR